LAQRPRISYARSRDGASLAFAVSGQGPAVVFAPWVPFSNLRMEWENPLLGGAYQQLGRRLTLIQYDGRGTGHSQRDVTDLSLEAMVSDLEAVVDQTGPQVFGLVGQYTACDHVVAYAARHPDRVNRIVLFGGAARRWDAMSAPGTQALLSLIEQDWNLFADTAAHQWMGWSAVEVGRATAEAFRGAVTPQMARATVRAASAVDVTDILPSVTAETLVLHRRSASLYPMDVSRSLAMDLPRGHLVILEGSQPSLFLEDTEGMIKLLVDFFCEGLVPSATSTSSAEAFPASRRQGAPVGTLSRRETEVLRLLAAGESNAQIARRLGISAYTIERHVVNIYRKIEARGRADATAYALRHGLG
jgi:DNA-binding CsgD family transcriptional regulator/pimeloyl-ACP methyl ester carboxylesterase